MAKRSWKTFFDAAPTSHNIVLRLITALRNGENQRQRAYLYQQLGVYEPLSFVNWKPVRSLNYANDVSKIALTDLDRATRTMLWIAATFEKNFGKVPCIAVGVKHGNACGAAVGDTPREALIGMIEGDTQALFGGSVVLNFPLSAEGADLLHTKFRGPTIGKRVLAGIAAPDVTPEAYEELFRKSRALVAFRNPALKRVGLDMLPKRPVYRHLPVLGAFIAEQADTFILDFKDERIRYEGVHERLREETLRDIALAWAVCWTSNSNTITITKGGRVLANAVGGQDRVGACAAAGNKVLIDNMGPGMKGLIAASDSFFPFTDGLETLHRYGVETVFATQGGERERQVAERARELEMSLVWLPDKIARGFFGH